MIAVLRRYWLDWTLVVLAIGSVWAVVVTTGRMTTGEQKARERQVLAVFRPDDCRRVVLENGGRKVVLERDQTQETDWRIVEPIREAAQAPAVRELWHALELARWVRRFAPEEVQRSEFGLDAPRAVVTLEMRDFSYRLVLGKAAVSPAGSAYLELAGEGAPGRGVMLVEGDLVKHLELGSESFREPSLVPLRNEELAEWVLEGPGGTRRLRRLKGRWRFDGMEQNRLADRRMLELMLLGMQKLDSERVLPPADAERALQGQGGVKVTLVPSEHRERRVVLELGGRCPDQPGQIVVLRREPDRRAGCTGNELLSTLSLPAEKLVMKRAFTLRPDEVESVSVHSGNEHLELARKESGFVLRAPKQAEVDAAVGNERLLAMLDPEGSLVETRELGRLGLDPPVGRAVVTSSGASEASTVEETVLLGAPDARGQIHVLRQADGAVLALDAAAARALTPDVTLLRSLELWNHPAAELRTIDLKGSHLELRLAQPSAGAFELVEPTGFAVDAAVASDWVEALGHLVAERWVAERDDGAYGLGRPASEVLLEVRSTGRATLEHRLRVGRLTTGGAFAQSDQSTAVFVLPRKTVALLGLLPIDRSALMVDTQTATRVVLVGRGNDRLVLERVGPSLERVGGVAGPNAGGLEELLEALASMRAEACLHTGPARPEEGLANPALAMDVDYPAAQGRKRQRIRFGAVDSWQDATVRYVRAEGIDATFVVMKSKVEVLLQAL